MNIHNAEGRREDLGFNINTWMPKEFLKLQEVVNHPNGFWELNLDLVHKWQVCLTIESSFQSQIWDFKGSI